MIVQDWWQWGTLFILERDDDKWHLQGEQDANVSLEQIGICHDCTDLIYSYLEYRFETVERRKSGSEVSPSANLTGEALTRQHRSFNRALVRNTLTPNSISR